MVMINGTSGNDILLGTLGDDQINGFNGSDTIEGLAGLDLMYGGNGNDVFVYRGGTTGLGGEVTDGAAESDTIRVTGGGVFDFRELGVVSVEKIAFDAVGSLIGQHVILASSQLAGGSFAYSLQVSGNGATTRYDNLEVNIDFLTPDADLSGWTFTDIPSELYPLFKVSVSGTDVANHIIGSAVEDFIVAMGGNDTILAGPGDNYNYLDGGAGDDIIHGGGGGEQLLGGDGNDLLFGGAGNDYLEGGSGSNMYDGGRGSDWANIYANAAIGVSLESNSVWGAATGNTLIGIENLSASNFADVLIGSNGDNSLTGNGGNDQLNGRQGNDSLSGSWGNDILIGGSGDDYLDGGSEIDRADYSEFGTEITVNLMLNGPQFVSVAAGSDTLIGIENLTGSAGADKITGNADDNALLGIAGSDTIFGVDGNDRIYGGLQNDVLRGNKGDDTIVGGGGGQYRDILAGGNGSDNFLFLGVADSSVGGWRDRIQDFVQGTDIIDLAAIDAVSGGADDVFVFVGNSAYSGTAGELRAFQVGAIKTVLQADLDGDTISDFELELTGLHVLTGFDFVL